MSSKMSRIGSGSLLLLAMLASGCALPPPGPDNGPGANLLAEDGTSFEGDPALPDSNATGDPEPDGGTRPGDETDSDRPSGAMTCHSCHGSETNPAPPIGLGGVTATTARGVGAHQSHLGPSDWHREISCEDCHLLPSSWDDPGHIDTALPAELTWGAVATARGSSPLFDGASCSDLYCHGAALSIGSGTNRAPTWTTVDGSQAACGTCHGLPPDAPHPVVDPSSCGPCHPYSGQLPDEPETHVNGVLDLSMTCGSCHAVPPQTGAHRAHYADQSQEPLVAYGDLGITADLSSGSPAGYLFACGNCHPTDPLKHMNGDVEVELHDSAAPASALKSLHPSSATFDGTTCSDVYCHSSGQEFPTYVTTPAWQGGQLAAPKCAACHDNPPAYPSGEPGSSTANLHLVLADDGWEFGHFAGLPGPWHTSSHGNPGSAPITCQTCHFDTVDRSNTGAGGFYYLDTTGQYDLGGNLGYECLSCHTGAAMEPAQGTGRANPLAHVNGFRDVVFDPRSTLPAEVSGVPQGTDRPRQPYWIANAGGLSALADWTRDGTTASTNLSGAIYDGSSKGCSNIPCHLNQSYGTGSPAWDPLVWGSTQVGRATCNACHQK